MAEEKKQWDFPVRKFICPPDIFGAGKYVLRKRFMKARVAAAIRQIENERVLFERLAEYIVEWNLEDFNEDGNWAGTPLDQPYKNPDVFGEMDCLEQLPWLVEALFATPPNFPSGR